MTLSFSDQISTRRDEIVRLFTDVFSASENAQEGAAIGRLVTDLLREDPENVHLYTAWNDGDLVGAIAFSRVWFAGDTRVVYILSPVAIATDCQRQGVGIALLTHGLTQMRLTGADVALTYGDPSYYGKVGFQQVSEDQVPAPMPLSYPLGWQAQDLSGKPLKPLPGPSTCVSALANPDYW